MRTIAFLAAGVLCIGMCRGQDPGYQHWVLGQSLPDWALAEFARSKLDSLYDWSGYINPFYLEADFNGDGSSDVAIAIEQRSSRKRGIAILHGARNGVHVIGAGVSSGNGGNDFGWMDVWHVEVLNEAADLIDGRTVKVSGAAIHVAKAESSSGLIYWDGQRYDWLQTGD